MKKILSLLSLVSIVSFSHATVIAYWDFNNGFNEASLSPQITHAAASGSGTLYQQRADTDGNGKNGNAFVSAPNGINAVAGAAMAWDDLNKTGVNDAEVFMTFSTSGYSNIIVEFDIRGNAGIIPSFDVKYSLTTLVDVTNPTDVIGTIKDFDGGLNTVIYNNATLNAVAAYQHVTLNLSSITDLDNRAYVALRFDDFNAGTGNNDMRIDNVLITGVAVPESSSMILGSAIGLLALRRRR